MAGKTKGTGFQNVRSFTTEHFGERGWSKVVSELDGGEASTLESMIHAGWYSLDLYARLIRAVDRLHGKGDLSLIAEIGRYEARHDFTVILRVFLRTATPAFILERATDLWKRFHDTGQWNVVRESKTQVTGTLRDWGVVDEALCVELTGYVQSALEMGNGRDVRVLHTECRGRGADACVFRVTWR